MCTRCHNLDTYENGDCQINIEKRDMNIARLTGTHRYSAMYSRSIQHGAPKLPDRIKSSYKKRFLGQQMVIFYANRFSNHI